LSSAPTPIPTESDALSHAEQAARTRRGYTFGLTAFGWWAVVVPVFFRVLTNEDIGNADPFEILAQRIVFGLPVLFAMLALSKQFGPFLNAIRTWSSLRVLIPSTGLIALNWYFFIWAVSKDQLSHASLGYYISPLVSVALGFVFLGERLRRAQWVAVALAIAAVCVLAWAEGSIPFVSIILPISFGLYGLLRKQANVGPSVGLTFEMLLLLPLSAGLLIWLEHTNRGVFLVGPNWISALMLLGGVVTIVPMVSFTAAARLLPLSTVGLLQYSAPTVQLVLTAVFFGESFPPEKWAAFGLIWIAIVIFTVDAIRRGNQARRDRNGSDPDRARQDAEPAGDRATEMLE